MARQIAARSRWSRICDGLRECACDLIESDRAHGSGELLSLFHTRDGAHIADGIDGSFYDHLGHGAALFERIERIARILECLIGRSAGELACELIETCGDDPGFEPLLDRFDLRSAFLERLCVSVRKGTAGSRQYWSMTDQERS